MALLGLAESCLLGPEHKPRPLSELIGRAFQPRSLWKVGVVDVRARILYPRVSIVVPFWGYLIGSLIYNWLNQKKELQWRL